MYIVHVHNMYIYMYINCIYYVAYMYKMSTLFTYGRSTQYFRPQLVFQQHYDGIVKIFK
jgi:hypothetical protein